MRSAPASPSPSTSGSRSHATCWTSMTLMALHVTRRRLRGAIPRRLRNLLGGRVDVAVRRRIGSSQTRNRAAESEARGWKARHREVGAPFAERPGGRYLRRLGPASPSFNGSVVPRHPSLETERLLLRPWRPAEDLDAFAALNADAEVMRFVAPNRPLTRAETAAQLERFVAHWDEHGFGLWAVVPRLEAGARCVGFAGLAIPSFLPAILPAVEVGWRLTPAVWGRGFATEAARASVAFGVERLRPAAGLSGVAPGNERSLRVAEKLGMTRAPDRLHPLTRRRLHVMQLGRSQGCDARPTGS